jgi:hypothetical protein
MTEKRMKSKYDTKESVGHLRVKKDSRDIMTLDEICAMTTMFQYDDAR